MRQQLNSAHAGHDAAHLASHTAGHATLLAPLHLAPVEARGHAPISAATSGNLAANRRRFSVRPPRRFALAGSGRLATSQRRALKGARSRHRSSAATSRPPPIMATRRHSFASGRQWQASMCPIWCASASENSILISGWRLRLQGVALVQSGAYLGSLRRPTTSLLFFSRAMSRAVLPSSVRIDGSAPPWRRRLAITRRPWAAAQ